MKKRIMIILGKEQFGYHTDTFNYCLYLGEKYEITVICRDYKLKKIHLNNIKVKYITNFQGRLTNGILRVLLSIYYIILINPELIFISEFIGCSIIKRILKRKKFVLDIRTSRISYDNDIREKDNRRIKKEASYFNNITIISEGVRRLIGIPENKAFILPLGSKTIVDLESIKLSQSSNKLSLIYVGTFYDRHMEDTIIAFNRFSEKCDGKNLTYTLIGFFEDNEKKEYIEYIKNLIASNKYNNIKYIGRVFNEELAPYFIDSNIGVSYIPITDYYNYQPATKTYEYLFNGLFTIATSTEENKKVINKNNGILIKDSIEEFYNALEYLYYNKPNISRMEIINSVKKYDWKNICEMLSQYLEKILFNGEEE